MTNQEIESCIICGGLTGKTSKEEPSLCGKWKHQLPGLPTKNIGDEVGPLCPGCYDCLHIVGLIQYPVLEDK